MKKIRKQKDDWMEKMTKSEKKLENKIRDPDKEFAINSVSRRDLVYLLGQDKEAVDDINSLSDEEIQEAISSIEYNVEYNDYMDNYMDELWEKLMKIIDKKQGK